MINYLLDLFQ